MLASIIYTIYGGLRADSGKIYEDQIHGFALRGDWSSDKDKKAMDDAEQQGIAWFKKHLTQR